MATAWIDFTEDELHTVLEYLTKPGTQPSPTTQALIAKLESHLARLEALHKNLYVREFL